MSGVVKRRVFLASWLVTLGWTVLLAYLLLKPGTAAHAGGSFSDAFFRSDFSRTDMIEAVAHVVMFGTLTLLWGWTLAFHYPARYAAAMTVMIAVLMGTATEFGQYFVARGALMLDLAANFVGIALSAVALRLFAVSVSKNGLNDRS